MRKNNRWDIDTINLTENPVEKKPAGKLQSGLIWFKMHWKRLLIVFGITYALLVTYGLVTTRYYTDDGGVRHAYRLSFADFRLQDDYQNLKRHFDSGRDLLAEITVIDIHVANGDLSNFEASALYTAVLNERLDVMIPKISSLNVQDSQKPIKEAMENLLRNDLALYLQNISAGLKTGNNDTVVQAMNYRDKALATYEVIKQSMQEISLKLHMNDEPYYKWNLSEAVREKDKTAVLKSVEGENS